MAMNVSSKTAIVTGAGSGINLSFAEQLLEKGCNVVIADLALRPEAQALIAKYPLSSGGAKAVFQKTDVTDWTQLDAMFSCAVEHFGGADIVCPGAGVYEPVLSSAFSFPFLYTHSQIQRLTCKSFQSPGLTFGIHPAHPLQKMTPPHPATPSSTST
jgi:NAD(P)-dependent dehydrogenase (short-subunit alcohol dehydrogenase family)